MSISILRFTLRDSLISNHTYIIGDTQGGGIGEPLRKFQSSRGDLARKPGGIVEQSTLLSAVENIKKNGAFL